jgi:hypothetical protein
MPSHEVGGLLETRGGMLKTFKMNFDFGKLGAQKHSKAIWGIKLLSN